jgi:hypothetical protein
VGFCQQIGSNLLVGGDYISLDGEASGCSGGFCWHRAEADADGVGEDVFLALREDDAVDWSDRVARRTLDSSPTWRANCQMFRSEQPTGGSTLWFSGLVRGNLRLRTRRLRLSTRNTQNTTSLYWFGPPESKTLRPVVGVDCLGIV